MIRSACILCALLLTMVLTSSLPAQNKKAPPDHGRVLATCIDVAPGKLKDTTKLSDTKNYVFRGRVISLGKDRRVSLCFDTEQMRVAGAWVGSPVVYAADKNMGPSVDGAMIFATKPGPGWAKDGKWDDPREGKEGPLPRDWAHFRGMYLHGDKVVLSYTVGDTSVLEMPDVTEKGGVLVVSRTFHFQATQKPMTLLIHEEPRAFTPFRLTAGLDKQTLLSLDGKGWWADCWVVGAAKTQLEVVGQQVHLRLPALPRGGTLKVYFSNGKLKQNDGWFERTEIEDLSAMTKGGPPRWNQTLETTGALGDSKSGPYTLDNIQLPEQNPWNASIRFGALDFFLDGRAALSTWDGDVWIVSGLDDKLGKVRWKRFAAGLHQPLGLKIIGGNVYVAGRDQITKLHDLNGDGEADFYENFNNDAGLTLQRHEYVLDLQTDQQGNLYYCRSGHYIQSKRGDNCVIYKLPPDGSRLEKFARGFREPNGMSISPDGVMTVADNEGNGIPQTPIYRLKAGADYGFTPSATGNVNQGSWIPREKPIVWLGPKIDTSAGGQVWAPVANALGSPRGWGPLSGQLLHTSYGNCALFSVLIDKQADPWQGAVWKFPFTFTSGIMRARFHPVDGQLYVCGLRGWGTSAVKDGQFARIRSTGKHLPIPVGYRVVKAGIELTFSDPLDKASAEDDDNYAGTWADVLKKVPNAKETQEMPIASARLSADRKTVTIGLEKIRAVPNFTLQYRIKAADGATVSGELNGTIHRIP